jgi:chemotaxis signal transduction protein
MCIELDYVERLEKIQLNQLESVGDNYIVRYLNKSMPIFDPVHFIGLKEKTVLDELRKKDDHELIELIVVNYEGMRFGFVVYELDEIQYSFEQVNTDTIVDEGLLGSIYIQNDTICILDLDYIYHKFCSAKKTLVKRDHDIYADVELDKTA